MKDTANSHKKNVLIGILRVTAYMNSEDLNQPIHISPVLFVPCTLIFRNFAVHSYIIATKKTRGPRGPEITHQD